MASKLDGILGQFELTKETLTAAALKVCYRKAAFKHHPDKKGDIEVFQALTTMFNVLKTFVDLTVCASYSPANLLTNYGLLAEGKLSAQMMLLAGWAAKIVSFGHWGDARIKYATEKLEQIDLVDAFSKMSAARNVNPG